MFWVEFHPWPPSSYVEVLTSSTVARDLLRIQDCTDAICKDEVLLEEGGPLIPEDWCPFKKRKDLDRDPCTGRTPYEDWGYAATGQGTTAKVVERPRTHPFLAPSGWTWPCLYLDLGLVPSRTVWQISVALASQSMVLCYSGPSKTIQWLTKVLHKNIYSMSSSTLSSRTD